MFEKYKSEFILSGAVGLGVYYPATQGAVIVFAALAFLLGLKVIEKRIDPEAERFKAEFKDLKAKVDQVIVRGRS